MGPNYVDLVNQILHAENAMLIQIVGDDLLGYQGGMAHQGCIGETYEEDTNQDS